MGFDDHAALEETRRLLTTWLGEPKPRFRAVKRDYGDDIVVEHGRQRMLVEVKRSATSASIGAAIEQVKGAARREHKAVPILVVPYMGELGKRLCADAGVSWFDLSGNATIIAPGVRIQIEGKPNKFVRRGRPSTVFAPKSARIARRLLIEPHRAFRQQELAGATGLDDGFTSRIVRRLEEDGLVVRDKGMVRVSSPDRLLDTWAEQYDFQKHQIVRGHVSARTGEELLDRMAEALGRSKVRYAATALAAAWLYTQFAGFRIVTLFVAERPSGALLESMKFREEPRGANVWLAIPNDVGVFDGANAKQGIECVHPVQAFLDLQSHPERAREAAAELRSRLLQWGA
jgi:Transcriptional regulator, AbiEi antitoxin, Type IV TA system